MKTEKERRLDGWKNGGRQKVEGRDGGRERGGEEESVLLRGGRNRY